MAENQTPIDYVLLVYPQHPVIVDTHNGCKTLPNNEDYKFTEEEKKAFEVIKAACERNMDAIIHARELGQGEIT